MKLFTTLLLSSTLIFTSLPINQAEAHGRGRGAAIAAGALILGLGIAAAAAEDRHHRRRFRYHAGDCDRYGCYYYDRFGTEFYRGDRIYEERRGRRYHRHFDY